MFQDRNVINKRRLKKCITWFTKNIAMESNVLEPCIVSNSHIRILNSCSYIWPNTHFKNKNNASTNLNFNIQKIPQCLNSFVRSVHVQTMLHNVYSNYPYGRDRGVFEATIYLPHIDWFQF